MSDKARYILPRPVALVVGGVFLICAYDLYEVAITTGNYRGMWFSLVHMAVVAAGAWYALRVAQDGRIE